MTANSFVDLVLRQTKAFESSPAVLAGYCNNFDIILGSRARFNFPHALAIVLPPTLHGLSHR